MDISDSEKLSISDEDLDFITEMMNIGTGNTATMLSEMLQTDIEIEIPKIQAIELGKIQTFLSNLTTGNAVSVKIRMTGDVPGYILFIVPEEKIELITQAVRVRTPSFKLTSQMIGDMANIIASVFLSAIHDFCGLEISHTIASTNKDDSLSLIDDELSYLREKDRRILLVESVFNVNSAGFKAYFLFLPLKSSFVTLTNAIEHARMKIEGR